MEMCVNAIIEKKEYISIKSNLDLLNECIDKGEKKLFELLKNKK